MPVMQKPSAADIRDELERILNDREFKATPRRRKLLAYLVEELLAGREKELKGYTIATDVFGRQNSFDPQADPIVRVEARRLRQDLDSYYVSAGRNNALRISIPKGQYAPGIDWAQASEPSAIVAAHVSSDGAEPRHDAPAAPGARARSRGRMLAAAAAVLCVVLIGVAGLYLTQRSETTETSLQREPSLTVLPFTTTGAPADQESLGKSLANEILNDLSQFPNLRLYVPGNETTGTADPMEFGDRLNLAYVLDGTVQLDTKSSVIRVSVRLANVRTRHIVWINKYSRNYGMGSLLAMQEEISAAVAAALGQPYGVIRNEETRRLIAETATVTSYECVLRAYLYRRVLTASTHRPAMTCLKEAVREDPGYADAWAMLGWLQMDAGRYGWQEEGSTEEAYRLGLATAEHALELDPKNLSALKALSSIHHYMGNFAESERLQRLALSLSPNDPSIKAQLGWRLAVRGRFEEGIPLLSEAIERSVNPPAWYYHLIAIDQYLKGEYEEMLKSAKLSTSNDGAVSWSLVAIAEGALGNEAEARQALDRMAAISPQLARDPAAIYRRHQATDQIVDALVAGLRKAGWKPAAAASDAF
jgi:TolB-like protein/Tfp pilus assembly protein PilF